MTWQYTIEWHRGPKSFFQATEDLDVERTKQNIVIVTSKPRSQSDEGLISVETWTSFDRPLQQNETRPFAIYAKVQRGSSPILRGKVIAQLEVLHINGTILNFAPIQLLDDGFGGEFFIHADFGTTVKRNHEIYSILFDFMCVIFSRKKKTPFDYTVIWANTDTFQQYFLCAR